MRALVASIFHTGTMFVMDLLPLKRGNVFDDPKDGCKYQLHLSDPHQNLLRERRQQCSTIVPLRHPDAVATSWASRGLDLSRLEGEWDAMTRLDGVFFFPIDAPDREIRLQELSRWLDIPLRTDWTPKNHACAPTRKASIATDQDFLRRFWP